MSLVKGYAITVDEATPQWLTTTLQRYGVLPTGSVVAVEVLGNPAFNSHTYHLVLAYSADAPILAPTNLLLKCSLSADWAKRAGAREVAFYTLVQSLLDHPTAYPNIMVRCFDAVCDVTPDGEIGNSHILLEDLSTSHIIPVEREQQIKLIDNLPTDTHLVQAIDALARFHAYWWGRQEQCLNVAPIAWGCSNETDFITETARRKRALEHLLAQEGEWLPPAVQTTYENILAQMPRLWQLYMRESVATFANLTLTHGDAYLANFLCPREDQREETTGNCYIIDWQCPEPYRAATDLVNLCATFWARAQRAENERELKVLRQYHRTLQTHGISGYAWDNLLTDYRLSILDWLWVPVQDAFDGSGKAYWWPKMQCLMQAFEDWNCQDLFV